jgi:sugar/nucleoside kinase (ribokinase family)
MTNDDFPQMIGVGSVFIDDIVLADGVTHMGVLGGGTVHALMGAALWDERPGLCAFVGNDLERETVDYLGQHFDTEGLVELDGPQMRAWQIFEHDGTRRELHRIKEIAPYVAGTQPQHLPPDYQKSQAFYLLQNFDGIHNWLESVCGLVLWEPNALAMLPDKRQAMGNVLANHDIDIVSPNLDEARTVYDLNSPDELIAAMFADGANIVALRMGAQGSIVADRATGEKHHLGVIDVAQIVDQTGAGNTYCGGLLCGLLHGKSLFEAAAMGTVAASFCLESIGTLQPDKISQTERDERLSRLLSNQ